MLWLIIRKEILQKLLDLRFGFSLLLCLVLTIASTYVLKDDYRQRLDDYTEKSALHKDWADNKLAYVDRPLRGLMTLFRGVMPNTGSTIKLLYDEPPRVMDSFNESPIFSVIPIVDWTFIIGVVMSLMAIFLSYDLVSGEKERGTLQLMLSYSVPRDMILVGKWLGSYLCLAVSFLICVLAGLVVLMPGGYVSMIFGNLGRLGVIFTISLIYLSAFFTLGLLFSVMSRMSSTSILRLLFVWSLCVLVVPNVSPYLAAAVYPVPSTQEIEQRMDEAVSASLYARKEKHSKAAEGISKENLSKEERREIRRMRDRIEQAELKKLRATFRKINARFGNRVQRQVDIAEIISAISPFACFTYIVTDLSNTGMDAQNKFIEVAERYSDGYFPGFVRMYKQARKLSTKKEYYQFLMKEFPKLLDFRYSDKSLSQAIVDNMPYMLAMVLFNVLFFMMAYLGFLRLDLSR